jgi:hypothetical protein
MTQRLGRSTKPRLRGLAIAVLTDEQWAALAPMVEACGPHAKVPPSELRCTVEAIL